MNKYDLFINFINFEHNLKMNITIKKLKTKNERKTIWHHII